LRSRKVLQSRRQDHRTRTRAVARQKSRPVVRWSARCARFGRPWLRRADARGQGARTRQVSPVQDRADSSYTPSSSVD